MFDISPDKKTQDAIKHAAEFHKEMTEPFIKWTKKFLIFPRKCYISGGYTQWFSKVMVGEETNHLRQMYKHDSHLPPNRVVYVKPEAFTFAQLRDDPRLDTIDG